MLSKGLQRRRRRTLLPAPANWPVARKTPPNDSRPTLRSGCEASHGANIAERKKRLRPFCGRPRKADTPRKLASPAVVSARPVATKANSWRPKRTWNGPWPIISPTATRVRGSVWATTRESSQLQISQLRPGTWAKWSVPGSWLNRRSRVRPNLVTSRVARLRMSSKRVLKFCAMILGPRFALLRRCSLWSENTGWVLCRSRRSLCGFGARST